jgi:O-antigen biosynthesis protein
LLERPYAGPLFAVHAGLAAVLDDARESGVAGQWRFLLDAAERLPDEAIVHVPQIVAHSRAPDREQCERERDAVAPRVRSLIEANGEHAVMDAKRSPWLRFAIAADCTVSIVIPTRDRYPLLERCLRSILADEFARNAEIVIVDNGSSDPRVPALLRTVGARVRVTIVSMDVPFNFPQLCNAGVEAAGGRIIVLLNNDCEVASTSLVELVGVAARSVIGAVGPLLLYPDGAVQSAGVLLGVNRTATSALAGFSPDDPAVLAWCRSRRQVSAVVGACLAVARDKYRRVGGMDELFAVSHNELDFCLRLEAEGFANAFTPFARVVHQEGGTRGFEVTAAERERLLAEEHLFVARWGRMLDAIDPAHHPAFARTGNAFAFRTAATPSARAGWR